MRIRGRPRDARPSLLSHLAGARSGVLRCWTAFRPTAIIGHDIRPVNEDLDSAKVARHAPCAVRSFRRTGFQPVTPLTHEVTGWKPVLRKEWHALCVPATFPHSSPIYPMK